MPEEHAQHNRPPLARSPKSLIERWPCEVKECRNAGQLCYWTVSDTADDHLPITSIVMQYWLAAITRRECTVDFPPPQVIEQWQRQNLRALQQKVKRRERQAERKAARDPSSPRVAFWRQRRAYQPSPLKNSVSKTCSEEATVNNDSVGMGVG
jgi:hypothetical protein